MSDFIVVFSYRHEYIQMGACGCCVDGGSCEDLEIETFYGEEAAANWLARRIQESPKARYSNLILQNGDLGGLVGYGSTTWTTQGVEGVKSIHVPNCVDEDLAWKELIEDEKLGQTEEAQIRRDKLCNKLRELVAVELKVLEEKKRQKDAAAKRLKKETEAKRKLERERKEYERLQKQFNAEQKG